MKKKLILVTVFLSLQIIILACYSYARDNSIRTIPNYTNDCRNGNSLFDRKNFPAGETFTYLEGIYDTLKLTGRLSPNVPERIILPERLKSYYKTNEPDLKKPIVDIFIKLYGLN